MGTLPNSKTSVAIFASGTGSNAQALLQKAEDLGQLPRIKAIITDNPDAGVIKHAQRFGIECGIYPIQKIPGQDFASAKKQQEQKIIARLDELHVQWILLAGYMRILSPAFLQHYYNSEYAVNQVVNIHPSALPAFPGKDGYGDAFRAGVETSGVTIHFVDAGIDTGPIIQQQLFARLQNDTLESFKARGLALEHQLYPKVLESIFNRTLYSKVKNETRQAD